VATPTNAVLAAAGYNFQPLPRVVEVFVAQNPDRARPNSQAHLDLRPEFFTDDEASYEQRRANLISLRANDGAVPLIIYLSARALFCGWRLA
jgi:hypothetical protein